MVEKIGPYRVYERLGVGGMGEVYKAYDDRLDRWVAIKRIRPDREDAEDNRERFKREARATARLNHPSIVHLYGIFQDGDSDCIVMEYVDGRTLDQVLAEEGPLDALRVASLGHEISSGLGEAHANGILHRDLKAENIMITPRGRAKILDFGLAKPILRSELDPVLTGKGQLVGTSRAMSPEYVSGENVDHRSDLFSLGVLLYECLTGHSPFKAHNTLATLKQVMLHKQTPVRQVSSRVPAELSDLIDQLLEKDPKDRPQSAHEVSLAFGQLTGQLSSGVLPAPSGLGSGVRRASSTLTTISASETMLDLRARRRWVPVLGVLVLLLIGAFVAGIWFGPDSSEPELPPDQRVQIVMADFETTENVEEGLGPPLAQALRAVLEQSRANTVLTRSQLRDALSRMQLPEETNIDRDIGREIAQREGAGRLIVGNVSKFGNKYSMIVDVVDPVTDDPDLTRRTNADTVDDLLAAIERIGRDIRRHLGESAEEIAATAKPLANVTTPDLDALKAYTLGLDKIADNENEEAISYFLRALEFDQDFAMAHAKLGVVSSNMGNRDLAIEHLTSAMEKASRLTEVDKFYVQGWLARWTGASQKAIDSWSRMSELYPGNYSAHFNLGMALWTYRNDFVGATRAFEAAVSVSQGKERDLALLRLGYCYLASNRSEEASEAFAQSNHPGQLWGSIDVATVLFEHQRALDLLGQLEETGPEGLGAVDLLSNQALIEADRGNFARASEASTRAVQSLDQLSEANRDEALRVLLDQASLQLFLDLPDDLKETTSELLELARESPEDLSSSSFAAAHRLAPTLSTLGQILLRMGLLEDASRVRRQLSNLPRDPAEELWQIYLLAFDAEYAAREGNGTEALGAVEAALSIAPSVIATETKARIAFERGDFDAAAAAYSEVAASRGLAAVECSSACTGQVYPLLSTIEALYWHGRAAEESGDRVEALELYRDFLARWDAIETPEELVPPSVIDARARVEASR